MNHRFSANIQKTDLSPNGNFAVVLLSSSATDDGCRLAFFNLAEKKLLWKLEPQVWPKSFIFNEKEKRLGLVESQGRGVYEYSYEGIFIDSERWEREHNIPISSWDYLRLAQIKLNDNFGSKLNPETANEIIKLMSQALSMDLNNWPYEQAKAYRKLGEIYEEIGNIALAIENYELAIISYPKIGVKRRLEKLKAQ